MYYCFSLLVKKLENTSMLSAGLLLAFVIWGMKNSLLLLFAIFVFGGVPAQKDEGVKIEKGVSENMAIHREKVLSQLRYQLYFKIPANKSEQIDASETISFQLKKDALPLQIDFKEKESHLKSVFLNGKKANIVLKEEHILIDPALLNNGTNTIEIKFTAGELSLNRNDEFLYTLLVPDRSRTLFPCFDQPGLKATFILSLELPLDWTALANAYLFDSTIKENSKIFRYGESDLFSTYLFSFAAGRFQKAKKEMAQRVFNFYYRETDSSKIRLSLDTIFGAHAAAINYLQEYTRIKFPFQKLDYAAIPDFQYGGMEHVGAIDYKAASLFLDSGATKDQENSRSNLIAHETAHMWFGDLVTMKWFNDVWMKEVFANFMADKITQGNESSNNYDLKFLLSHFPRAYAVDRTKGANPIRQPLSNLQEAGSLYGAIIYDKAPVMMRQLERLMGAEAFRDGLREYLKKYSFGNATWPDLITILDNRTAADLQAWNKVWVNTPGRPQLAYSLQQKNGLINKLVVSQKGEQSQGYVLPQFFELAFVYAGHIEEITVNMNKAQTELKEAEGKKMPVYILFNSSGQGYGLFPVDTLLSKQKMADEIIKLANPVMRASAYINWYENMLSANYLKPEELLGIYKMLLSKEKEELNLSLIAGQFADIYWRLLPASKRSTLASNLETTLWEAMEKEPLANKKKILFRLFQSISLSKNGLDSLFGIWKNQKPPVGVKLTEEDYSSLALNLMVKEYADTSLLNAELKRIANPDRKQRLEFLMPALSKNPAVRDTFFASLKNKKIRKKESWVVDAVNYLHHPLRTAVSIKYLKESLELLEEIQMTGDIFFPGAWLNATFGSYQSKEAAMIVQEFLKAHPFYNPKLKAKILQATDPLFRAEKLLDW